MGRSTHRPLDTASQPVADVDGRLRAAIAQSTDPRNEAGSRLAIETAMAAGGITAFHPHGPSLALGGICVLGLSLSLL